MVLAANIYRVPDDKLPGVLAVYDNEDNFLCYHIPHQNGKGISIAYNRNEALRAI